MTDPDLRALVQRLREYPPNSSRFAETLWERCQQSAVEIESLLARAESVEAECARLRTLLCECARAVGARVDPSASIEFMGEIPGEVRIACLRARGGPA